jgi:hypothetical protein
MNGINCGDLATWLSSIASFAAVVVALTLARRADKPKAEGWLSIVFVTPEFERKLLCYRVVNLGTHSLRINSPFLEVHPFVRRFVKWPSAIAGNWTHPINSQLPADLQRGESFTYATDVEHRSFADFLADFPAPPWLIVRLIRAGVTTPWGSIYLKISGDVRTELETEIVEKRLASGASAG